MVREVKETALPTVFILIRKKEVLDEVKFDCLLVKCIMSERQTINNIAGVMIITSSIPPNKICDSPKLTTILAITLKTVRITNLIFFVIKNKNIKHKNPLTKVSNINSWMTFFSKYNSLGDRPLTKTFSKVGFVQRVNKISTIFLT